MFRKEDSHRTFSASPDPSWQERWRFIEPRCELFCRRRPSRTTCSTCATLPASFTAAASSTKMPSRTARLSYGGQTLSSFLVNRLTSQSIVNAAFKIPINMLIEWLTTFKIEKTNEFQCNWLNVRKFEDFWKNTTNNFLSFFKNLQIFSN